MADKKNRRNNRNNDEDYNPKFRKMRRKSMPIMCRQKLKYAKKLLITEKPSVAMEFAKSTIKNNNNRKNGYLESSWIITWCVGHLVTMSYPEKYDEKQIGD